MFIKKIEIKIFRIFASNRNFEIDNINISNRNLGSDLTAFVGENACGQCFKALGEDAHYMVSSKYGKLKDVVLRHGLLVRKI